MRKPIILRRKIIDQRRIYNYMNNLLVGNGMKTLQFNKTDYATTNSIENLKIVMR